MCVYIVYTRLYIIHMHFHIIDSNACLSHPCQNGGTCDKTTGGFQCVCTEDYEGFMCACKCVLQLLEKHMSMTARAAAHTLIPEALNYEIQHHLNMSRGGNNYII